MSDTVRAGMFSVFGDPKLAKMAENAIIKSLKEREGWDARSVPVPNDSEDFHQGLASQVMGFEKKFLPHANEAVTMNLKEYVDLIMEKVGFRAALPSQICHVTVF